ncbi:MAG: galactokinase [Wujia sp.]
MKDAALLISEIKDNKYRELLSDIYIDESKLEYHQQRYIRAIEKYIEVFGDTEVEIYSAPGRSEIGGNHTDHQHGEVLAASINNDAIAIVNKSDDNIVKVLSDDYALITIDVSDITLNESEKGTTIALIKGVLSGLKEHGYRIGGFSAYITSDVLIGAGLSSSAAFETLIGTIISGLYNSMSISAVEIAIIGQYAENVYFGKPCGLMDQMACSVGSLVHIDFADPAAPDIEKIDFDMAGHGYSLCITDTKGSHADLTDDYAAIPMEMKQIASYFGKDVLREITLSDLFENISKLRDIAGDRAVLRAIHFVQENERVRKEVAALKSENISEFLANVKASGDSSFKYLQNVYTNRDVKHQNMSLALAASDSILSDNGTSRVHGGGFAGTIQAFVRKEAVVEYKRLMDGIFGEGSCSILMVRKYGGMRVL